MAKWPTLTESLNRRQALSPVIIFVFILIYDPVMKIVSHLANVETFVYFSLIQCHINVINFGFTDDIIFLSKSRALDETEEDTDDALEN